MSHFPLENSYLCECGTVMNSAVQCPACANRHGLLNLASVLNRKPVLAETAAILALLNGLMKEKVRA